MQFIVVISELLAYLAKVVLGVLTKRIEAKVYGIKHIGEDQFGFRRAMGTRDAVAVLRVFFRKQVAT